MDPMPVPRDFPLPLPAAESDLELAIIVLFAVHILFVNLMLGGALLTLAAELRGLARPAYDRLAQKIAATITINKSLAVVLGVGPLLVINALYGLHFYTANALTGRAWILLVPTIAGAFLLLYLHKYSWQALADRKGLHITIGAAGTLLLLAVPLVFLSNINLMLFPSRWPDVAGFLSAVALPNVLPRYLHFVLASLAVTGLFLAGWLCRRGFDFESELPGLDRCAVKRELLGVALAATAAQLVAGPLVLLTLPPNGVTWLLLGNLALAVTLAAAAAVLLWRESALEAPLGPRFWMVVVLLGGTVGLMVLGRHLYREEALAPHRALVAAHTAAFRSASLGAEMRLAAGTPRLGPAEAAASPGERVFRATCMACHDLDARRVGPPLREIADLYAGNPSGLIAWVKAPGRKRPDYPEMPPITMQQPQYDAVAAYILDELFTAAEESAETG
ncbi:MAG TPA: c-type cytochrome [Candidatus Sulfomarinibacteraceae bacterium]|nr:c-type cytochrome [Candidatus Sulfomarinibacteraceae bacterium]